MRRAFRSCIFVATILTLAAQAYASTITVSSSMSGSGTAHRTTTGTSNLITFTPSFQQFDPSLGALQSATLDWAFSGTVTVTENQQLNPDWVWDVGNVAFNYGGTSQVKNYDTDVNPVLTFNGPTGSLGLSLPAVTGLGTFTNGAFLATFTMDQGTFPVDANGNATGQFLVTYNYLKPGENPDGGNREAQADPVPEPSTYLLLAGGLAAVWVLRSSRP
jgi:hypothetical protein